MPVSNKRAAALSPSEVVTEAQRLYSSATTALRDALADFGETGRKPAAAARRQGAFAYPELSVTYKPGDENPHISSAFGKFNAAGRYAVTVTRPEFFRTYLEEQLQLLVERYKDAVTIAVKPSAIEIPYPYVLTKQDEQALEAVNPRDLARFFPAPDLVAVNDAVADGERLPGLDPMPLALFDAPRVDYSLHRLAHYTGAPADAVQNYVLFTNYTLYVDEFVAWAIDQVRADGPYEHLVLPGGQVIDAKTPNAEEVLSQAPWRKFQMPAYHLTAPGKEGLSLINIGVGPSNAKTMTDHLAVLRPQCWLMIGHCGGLRDAQRLGDYVLAHAYLRRDRVLDDAIPLEVPVPPIAEIQIALQDAAAQVTGEKGEALKRRLRTGTIVTNADRNWELRAEVEARLFNKSRAIAIDMESATIATNGFRLRVPYGALLCVSDKPLHGELKLPGPARRFYQQAVSQHLQIGIAAIELLKQDGGAALHSRKLRAFDEPPFR